MNQINCDNVREALHNVIDRIDYTMSFDNFVYLFELIGNVIIKVWQECPPVGGINA